MNDGKWTRSQKLVASDRSPSDEFGFSVAIDGDNAVVGARGVTLDPKDENNNGYTGEAYIFSRNENGDWKEVKYIIFDLPSSKEPYENRIETIKQLKLPSSNVEIIKVIKCENNQHLQEQLNNITKLGGEGLMAMKPQTIYTNSRTSSLLKIKVSYSFLFLFFFFFY